MMRGDLACRRAHLHHPGRAVHEPDAGQPLRLELLHCDGHRAPLLPPCADPAEEEDCEHEGEEKKRPGHCGQYVIRRWVGAPRLRFL